MKRLTTILMAILLAVVAMAADMTGLKVYINPGHGGFDSNDRSIWTIPVPAVWTDSAGYWESKSNLVKGLYLKQKLEAAGAQVIISREKNDSGIRDIDEFRKNHPNATQHEIDSVMVGGDRDLSAIAEEANAYKVDQFISIHSNALNGKTNYLLMLFRGENDKPQTAPSNEMAALAGSIQIQNQLTTWTSAAPIIRGDLTFYGDGYGLGVLRPLTVPGFLSEGSFHDYAPETHRLMNSDYCHLEALRMYQYFHKWFKRDLPQTATISGYVKSKNEKADVLGESKFYYLPGSDDQWKPLNGALVKLIDATGQTILQTLTTDTWYNGVFAFYDVAPGTYKVVAECLDYKTDTMQVTVVAEDIATVKMHLQNIHLDADNYPEPDQAGVVALSEYEFEAGADMVTALPQNILRAAYRRNGVYILTSDNNIIRCNPVTLAVENTLSLSDVTIKDIAFSADDYLVALAENAIYAWDENDKNPRKIYETTTAWGNQFAVDGPLWRARFYVVNSAANGFVAVQYSDGMNSANIQTEEKLFSTDLNLADAAPMIMPDNNVYVYADDNGIALNFNWTAATITKIQMAQPAQAGANFMRYAGKSYMVMPVLTEGAHAQFAIYDITDGIDKAVAVSQVYPENGLGMALATYTTTMTSVEGYQINIYLLAQGEGYQYWKSLSNPVANIYAGEVNWDETKISFRLNEDALSVELGIEQEGATVASVELGAMKRGYHTVDNPFTDKEYDAVSITATARPVSFPQLVTTDAPEFKFYSIYGVGIDKTPSSPYFGRIYVTDRSGGLTSEGNGPHRTTQRGVYILGNDFTDVTAQGENAYTGGIDWGTNNNATGYQNAPRKASVAPNGDVFITSSIYTSANIYIMNPAAPQEDFVPVFRGSRKDGGQLRKGMNVVMNPPMDCYITGNSKKRVLYTMDRNNSLGTVYTNIVRYDIGTVELPWYDVPTATIFDDQLTGSFMQNGNGQFYPDARGGWWMSQYRFDGTYSVPSFIHINKSGQVDYNNFSFANTALPNRWGGMALTTDGNRMAVMTSAGITRVYDITYGTTPSLELTYTIEWGATDDISYCHDFDAAGNLYIADNLGERLLVFSLPNLQNTFTTRISLIEQENDDPEPGPGPTPDVGVENVHAGENISIYPNPATDMINIQSASKVMNTAIYSLTGQLQFSVNEQNAIDVSNLQSGMYLLRIKTAEGTEVINFIKQ